MPSLLDGYMTQIGGSSWYIAEESSKANLLLPADVTPNQWYRSGRISLGNAPGSSPYALVWGQIFKANGATVSADVLIKVRNIELWMLSIATGLWSRVQYQLRMSTFSAQYDSAFVDVVVPANIYSVAPAPTISEVVPGRFFHFFPSDQFQFLDVNDVGGLIGCFEAKLISKTGANIEGQVGTIIGSVGCDFRALPGNAPTGDSFIGSFTQLTTSYRRFYGSTLRYPGLRLSPAPVDLAQLTQTDAQGIDPDYVAP